MNTLRTLLVSMLTVLLAGGCSREREEYFNGRASATADAAKGALRVAHANDVQLLAWWGSITRGYYGRITEFSALTFLCRATQALPRHGRGVITKSHRWRSSGDLEPMSWSVQRLKPRGFMKVRTSNPTGERPHYRPAPGARRRGMPLAS